ncbi:glycosyltransferase [Oleiagrimonas sp. C23AA]|uniref:glycosyltransferase n=1 Tax=Oleiagrimonas sp. C23AA TaxID=2719047 RepID=UPI0014208569|nr:glycosyltransferase [Oleiagrimonas sp. C23AA]NII09727.1 glycosyltransferase family 1 protein [Oleiagrimonas sp. C23AA]
MDAHIVMATVGSAGDLYPFLAVAQALAARGHRCTVASHAMHESQVRQAGQAFVDASGLPEPEDKVAFMARAFHPWRGPRFVVRELAAQDTAESYRRLHPVCAEADVLLTSTLAFGAQILGEQLPLAWLSVVLAPAGFISAYQPPATGLGLVDRWSRQSPSCGRILQRGAQWISRPWTAPVRQFRRQLGLAPQPAAGDPFHAGQHGRDGVLALFSPLLAQAQPDWPPHTHVTGFARYRPDADPLPDTLRQFLDAGPAPVVFTLGSAAVHAGAHFLRESMMAARALRMRAILLCGSQTVRRQLPALSSDMLALEAADHAPLFERAAAVVHHGGIGTSAEALRAGVPMLVVPHGFDQPDNAARLQRLGVAEILPASRYDAAGSARQLARLTGERDYRDRTASIARTLQAERGAERAADVIEAALARRASADARR